MVNLPKFGALTTGADRTDGAFARATAAQLEVLSGDD
jgi:hypothetical protein